MKHSLAVVLGLSLAGAGCATTAGEQTAAAPAPSAAVSSVELPESPPVPAGALDPQVAAAVAAVFASPLEVPLDEIDLLGASGDVRVAWLVADLLRFHQGQEPGARLTSAAERLTGVPMADAARLQNPDPQVARVVAWTAYSELLLRWDIPAPPDYFEHKRDLHLAIEPRWGPFFDIEADLDWREVSWGGVLRDAIPALDDPAVVPASDGGWLPEDDVVFGVVVAGEARAYPRRVLEVHELANDSLGGRRIGLPYCTLCGAAVAYLIDALPGGTATLQLRTSGLLQRSNKLMYDAITESLFDQFLGVPLSGPLNDSGIELERIPVVTTTWAQWRDAHPDTTIIAADGGVGRRYRAAPLGGRDAYGPIFPVGTRDERLPVQEPVFGVMGPDGTAVAFPVAAALEQLEAGEEVAAAGVTVNLDAGGLVALDAGGRILPGHQAFWFAWSQFRPGTHLWQAEPEPD